MEQALGEFSDPERISKFSEAKQAFEAKELASARREVVAQHEGEDMEPKGKVTRSPSPTEPPTFKQALMAKMTRRQTVDLIQFHTRQRLANQRDDEVNVTDGFRAKYIEEHGVRVAGLDGAMPALEEAHMKVAFLLQKMQFLQEEQQRELALSEVKVETRLREFVQQALHAVQTALEDQFLGVFMEMQRLYYVIQSREETIRLTKLKVAEAHRQLAEVETWAQFDETAHDQMCEKLMKSGISSDALLAIEIDLENKEEKMKPKEYIDYLLSKQPAFGLYSGQLRLKATERLNLLERETIQLYHIKL